MATINLGAIKFNWKGAYNSGTSYAVDDVVSSGGNSYVCIQAHSNQAVGNATAYWNIMSSAGTNGTNGTDLTSTLTTQGDILYRDGSGLARLGYGTSGKVLTTKGSGQNPAWETASGGKVLQYKHVIDATNRSTTSTSYTQGSSALALTVTPSSTSSKIFVMASFTGGYGDANRRANYTFHRDISGGTQNANLAYGTAGFGSFEVRDGYSVEMPMTYNYVDAPSTTSACTYYVVMKGEAGVTTYMGNAGATGHMFLMELEG